MEIEKKLVQEFLREHGRNPAHWVIGADDENLKRISQAAFRETHKIRGHVIFYNEGCHRPSLQKLRR